MEIIYICIDFDIIKFLRNAQAGSSSILSQYKIPVRTGQPRMALQVFDIYCYNRVLDYRNFHISFRINLQHRLLLDWVSVLFSFQVYGWIVRNPDRSIISGWVAVTWNINHGAIAKSVDPIPWLIAGRE